MPKLLLTITVTLLVFACKQRTVKAKDGTLKEGNKSTTISTDTAKLARLINIAVYKSTNVKFKYVFIDNSAGNERLSVPGPSDYYLEAVLYFDSSTLTHLRDAYYQADYPSPNYTSKAFNFEWLDNNVRQELLNTDTSYHGDPGFPFGQQVKVWFLDKKVLLAKDTN